MKLTNNINKPYEASTVAFHQNPEKKPMPHPGRGPVPGPGRDHFPPDPHLDSGMITYDEEDFELLTMITEDPETAASAMRETYPAPPEMKDILYQLIRVCHIVSSHFEPVMKAEDGHCESETITRTECNSSHYPSAVLDGNGREHFRRIYPEYSDKFFNDFFYAPKEVSVISRLILFIEETLRNSTAINGGESNEDNEDC